MSTHRPTYYGIDPAIIEAATRKARRERSEAVWRLIGGLFPSVSDDQSTKLEAANDQDHSQKRDAA